MVIVHRDCLKIAYFDMAKLNLCIHRTMGRKWKATLVHEINIQAALATKQHHSYPELLDVDSLGEEDNKSLGDESVSYIMNDFQNKIYS